MGWPSLIIRNGQSYRACVREPKTVDWTDTIGEDAGKTLLAIYSLEGDRLVFCAAYPGQERPTEFRTRPGQVLRVSQRESP